MWFLSFCASAVGVSAALSAGLYGMSENLSTGKLALVSIDPRTGKQTVVGKYIASEAQSQALATVDDQNGVYYILGFGKAPNIVGINVTTGAVVSEANIPEFASEAFIGVGQGIDWEPDTGSIVVAGQDTSQSWMVGLVDPQSGKFDQKAYVNNSAGQYDPVLGSPSVYATDQKDFVMLLGVVKPTPGIDFLAVNVESGKVRELPWCGDTETADYDPVAKAIYGIGLTIDPLAPGGAVRTLVEVQSDASGCRIVGNVTGYWVISMGVSAIDSENRVLYFLSFPCAKKGDPGCQGGGPLDLVGVALNTSKIVSVASAFCTVPDTCPWSLEFVNPIKDY